MMRSSLILLLLLACGLCTGLSAPIQDERQAEGIFYLVTGLTQANCVDFAYREATEEGRVLRFYHPIHKTCEATTQSEIDKFQVRCADQPDVVRTMTYAIEEDNRRHLVLTTPGAEDETLEYAQCPRPSAHFVGDFADIVKEDSATILYSATRAHAPVDPTASPFDDDNVSADIISGRLFQIKVTLTPTTSSGEIITYNEWYRYNAATGEARGIRLPSDTLRSSPSSKSSKHSNIQLRDPEPFTFFFADDGSLHRIFPGITQHTTIASYRILSDATLSVFSSASFGPRMLNHMAPVGYIPSPSFKYTKQSEGTYAFILINMDGKTKTCTDKYINSVPSDPASSLVAYTMGTRTCTSESGETETRGFRIRYDGGAPLTFVVDSLPAQPETDPRTPLVPCPRSSSSCMTMDLYPSGVRALSGMRVVTFDERQLDSPALNVSGSSADIAACSPLRFVPPNATVPSLVNGGLSVVLGPFTYTLEMETDDIQNNRFQGFLQVQSLSGTTRHAMAGVLIAGQMVVTAFKCEYGREPCGTKIPDPDVDISDTEVARMRIRLCTDVYIDHFIGDFTDEFGNRATFTAGTKRGVILRKHHDTTQEYILSQIYDSATPVALNSSGWHTKAVIKTWAKYPPSTGQTPLSQITALLSIDSRGTILLTQAIPNQQGDLIYTLDTRFISERHYQVERFIPLLNFEDLNGGHWQHSDSAECLQHTAPAFHLLSATSLPQQLLAAHMSQPSPSSCDTVFGTTSNTATGTCFQSSPSPSPSTAHVYVLRPHGFLVISDMLSQQDTGLSAWKTCSSSSRSRLPLTQLHAQMYSPQQRLTLDMARHDSHTILDFDPYAFTTACTQYSIEAIYDADSDRVHTYSPSSSAPPTGISQITISLLGYNRVRYILDFSTSIAWQLRTVGDKNPDVYVFDLSRSTGTLQLRLLGKDPKGSGINLKSTKAEKYASIERVGRLAVAKEEFTVADSKQQTVTLPCVDRGIIALSGWRTIYVTHPGPLPQQANPSSSSSTSSSASSHHPGVSSSTTFLGDALITRLGLREFTIASASGTHFYNISLLANMSALVSSQERQPDGSIPAPTVQPLGMYWTEGETMRIVYSKTKQVYGPHVEGLSTISITASRTRHTVRSHQDELFAGDWTFAANAGANLCFPRRVISRSATHVAVETKDWRGIQAIDIYSLSDDKGIRIRPPPSLTSSISSSTAMTTSAIRLLNKISQASSDTPSSSSLVSSLSASLLLESTWLLSYSTSDTSTGTFTIVVNKRPLSEDIVPPAITTVNSAINAPLDRSDGPIAIERLVACVQYVDFKMDFHKKPAFSLTTPQEIDVVHAKLVRDLAYALEIDQSDFVKTRFLPISNGYRLEARARNGLKKDASSLASRAKHLNYIESDAFALDKSKTTVHVDYSYSPYERDDDDAMVTRVALIVSGAVLIIIAGILLKCCCKKGPSAMVKGDPNKQMETGIDLDEYKSNGGLEGPVEDRDERTNVKISTNPKATTYLTVTENSVN